MRPWRSQLKDMRRLRVHMSFVSEENGTGPFRVSEEIDYLFDSVLARSSIDAT